MSKNSLIILSGGMDSVTMLHEYKDSISLAVSFDYGSNHAKRELEMAALNSRELGIEHIIIPLGFISQYFNSSLLAGADAIPEGHYTAENMRSTVVPFRNGIMLSIAAGIAESRGLEHVMIANHAGDHIIYSDCRHKFIELMNDAISKGTDSKVSVFAPYTDINKTDIARHGKELGMDYTKTYSCYKGGDKHCGKCGTCVERKEALHDAGIEDKTEYES